MIKCLRKKFMVRMMTVFFLIVFIQSLFPQQYLYALTTGPHQPEYIAYEPPGNTDMVNLMTGDFTFSLPVLEVPGPEGNFSLPLSYHAGIGVDQESTWTGLGWVMNPGAVTRSINEFPDDASGETHSVTVQDLTGVRGWSSNLLGFGNIGWNSEVGHYGTISLFNLVSMSYSSSGVSSVGVAGINVGGGGVSFDGAAFTMACVTVASWGAGGAFAQGSEAATKGLSLGANMAIDAGAGALTSFLSDATPNSPTSGYWKYSKKVKQKFLHKEYKIWLDQTRKEDMFGSLYLGKVNNLVASPTSSTSSMNVLLTNGGTSETMYQYKITTGSTNQGSASDINYETSGDFATNNNPATLAYDDYSVKAAGISGSISPYRLDIGSVSMPREMTSKHVRLAPIRYLDYKVPFLYDGALSNSYFHHVGASSSVTTPTVYTGISSTFGNATPASNTSMTYNLSDVIFKNQRVRSDLADFLTAGNTQNKFPQGNHVEWLSNTEIKSSLTYASGFLDFLSGESATGVSGSERGIFRSNFALNGVTVVKSNCNTTMASFSNVITISSTDIGNFHVNDPVDINIDYYPDQASMESGTGAARQSFTGLLISAVGTNTITVPLQGSMAAIVGKYADIEILYVKNPPLGNAIGGYCITGPDGTMYHFALPVYDYDLYTEMKDVTDPTNKKSIVSRTSPFANTWLLTAITGPDFIDRNTNGLADDGDWGFWVKFNYGNYADTFSWRIPYAGDKRSPDDLFDSYTKGNKQLYYLNTIETRSHVALFMKSARDDSKSLNSVSSQKLDEICLLSKERYKTLIKSTAQGGYGIDDYTNKVNNRCNSSLFTGSSIRAFINLHCLKRVLFNYSYDLCKNTSNSVVTANNPNKGKLTLVSLSIRGRNDLKTVPDYKFEYGYNPDYDANKWDAWGLYNPSGTAAYSTHKAYNGDAEGAAWSLSKIVTPLGNEILVNYERDMYSSVSGNSMIESSINFFSSNITYTYSVGFPIQKLYISNGSLAVGDKVVIQGDVSYKCPSTSVSSSKSYYVETVVTGTGSDSGGSYINVADDYMGIAPACTYSGSMQVEFQGGVLEKLSRGIKGGDIRVASITNRDEWGTENKIRYLYNNDDGTSAGVVSKESEYAKSVMLSSNIDGLPGYPTTPVIYGKVTVLNGKLTTDSDFHTRQVYEFETPHYSQYTLSKTTVKARTLVYTGAFANVEYAEAYQHGIVDRTSKVGTLKSTKVYDKAGALQSSSQMVYTDQTANDAGNSYQGLYSEGTMMFDRAMVVTSTFTTYNKANRTTKLTYPWTLEKIINTKDGFSTETQNLKWDFLTGGVIEKLDKNSLGINVKTVTVPAYKKNAYTEFGPKGSNVSNKHMLTQTAATYSYRADNSGNAMGLIAASAQTWVKNWTNYRVYNTGTQVYEDGSEGAAIWRKGASYTWKGNVSKLQQDGTHKFVAADEFNFDSPASNTNWQYGGELLRFDHFSMPLESKSYDNIYAASKMGYDSRVKIAEASNAKYGEIAFSSAEDPVTGLTPVYFGGEVAAGAGTVVTTPVHTGKSALQLTSASKGFIFKSSGVLANKTYRAVVWANSVNGRIYYKINSGTEQVQTPVTSQAVSVNGVNWYRLEVLIPIGNVTTPTIEVGVKPSSGTVVFDDFRFQPLDAVMTCYVHAPLTYEFPAGSTTSSVFDFVLDNDNCFTRYEYSERGLLKNVYGESMKYGVKKVSEANSDYRRFHINQ